MFLYIFHFVELQLNFVKLTSRESCAPARLMITSDPCPGMLCWLLPEQWDATIAPGKWTMLWGLHDFRGVLDLSLWANVTNPLSLHWFRWVCCLRLLSRVKPDHRRAPFLWVSPQTGHPERSKDPGFWTSLLTLTIFRLNSNHLLGWSQTHSIVSCHTSTNELHLNRVASMMGEQSWKKKAAVLSSAPGNGDFFLCVFIFPTCQESSRMLSCCCFQQNALYYLYSGRCNVQWGESKGLETGRKPRSSNDSTGDRSYCGW